jgi:hypothetical protein
VLSFHSGNQRGSTPRKSKWGEDEAEKTLTSLTLFIISFVSMG